MDGYSPKYGSNRFKNPSPYYIHIYNWMINLWKKLLNLGMGMINNDKQSM